MQRRSYRWVLCAMAFTACGGEVADDPHQPGNGAVGGTLSLGGSSAQHPSGGAPAGGFSGTDLGGTFTGGRPSGGVPTIHTGGGPSGGVPTIHTGGSPMGGVPTIHTGGSPMGGDCDAGNDYCAGHGCVDLQTDPNDCGSCGNACTSGSCVAGICSACPAGRVSCPFIAGGSACTDLNTDGLNCGRCGNKCSDLWTGENDLQCVQGQCRLVCGAGKGDCGGQYCTDFRTTENCGACGAKCAASQSCVKGTCTCAPRRTSCGGACVSLEGDPSNCGSCGHACPAGLACSAGTCVGQDGGDLDGGAAANRVNMIAGACNRQCSAQQAVPFTQCPPAASCAITVCPGPVAPGSAVPTALGCEDAYVNMTLCLGDVPSWTCSDWGNGVLFPAPVAGGTCESSVCAWTCCDHDRGGILWDPNVATRCGCA